MSARILILAAVAALAAGHGRSGALAAEKCGTCNRPAQARSYPAESYRPQAPREADAREAAEKRGRMLDALRKAGSQPVNLHQSQLTQQDSGKSRSVPLGDPLFIRLSGSPSTGCQWKVVEQKGSSLRLDGAPVYYPRPEKRGGASASGAYVFKFTTPKAGKTSLKLVYAKPGDEKKRPMNLFTATIDVRADLAKAAASTETVTAQGTRKKSETRSTKSAAPPRK